MLEEEINERMSKDCRRMKDGRKKRKKEGRADKKKKMDGRKGRQ